MDIVPAGIWRDAKIGTGFLGSEDEWLQLVGTEPSPLRILEDLTGGPFLQSAILDFETHKQTFLAAMADYPLTLFEPDTAPLHLPRIDYIAACKDIAWDDNLVLYVRGVVYPARIRRSLDNRLRLRCWKPTSRQKLQSRERTPPQQIPAVAGLPHEPEGYIIDPYVGNVGDFNTFLARFKDGLRPINHRSQFYALVIHEAAALAGWDHCRPLGIRLAQATSPAELLTWETLLILLMHPPRTLNILVTTSTRPAHFLDPRQQDDSFWCLRRGRVTGLGGIPCQLQLAEPTRLRSMIVGNLVQIVDRKGNVMHSKPLQHLHRKFTRFARDSGLLSDGYARNILHGGRAQHMIALAGDPDPSLLDNFEIAAPIPHIPVIDTPLLRMIKPQNRDFRLVAGKATKIATIAAILIG
ncbi:hypothetical protein B0H13DRAFT_2148832 [Mycena leptocephala]|nr:hypothetical protein B0H13DRAFT_2148832 [Mycena leptocephala]